MGPEEVLRLEREWLLYEEAVFVSKQLRTFMMHSLCCLGTHHVGSFAKDLLGPEPGPEEQKLIEASRVLTSFETPQGQLKGFLSAEGWTVKDAELNIRPAPKQPPIKIHITQQHPLIVPQLQNAHNYLEVGLIQLDDLQRILERLKNGQDVPSSIELPSNDRLSTTSIPSSSSSVSHQLLSKNTTSLTSTTEPLRAHLKEVKHRIEKIAAHLVKAQQQLTWNIDCWGLPLQELAIPNGLFSPPLPVGLLLRLSIENGDLSFSLYYLNKIKKSLSSISDAPPPLTSMSSQSGGLNLNLNGGGGGGGGGLHLSATGGPVAHPSGSYLGYAFKLAAQGQTVVVEVVEQADVKCNVGTYNKVLKFLNKGLQLCNEFVDKANALE